MGSELIDQLRTEILGMHGLVIQLKNGVGDLRAEWLLIKREVNGIKTETLRLQVCCLCGNPRRLFSAWSSITFSAKGLVELRPTYTLNNWV